MIDQALHRATQCAARPYQTGWSALLLGLATFGLLWILGIPYRENYVLNQFDIPALADGLLLSPGAHWTDWFTQGYSHFWDRYPEWPQGDTAFTRPAFQFVIYLAHFAIGRNWAAYQFINCFAAAGMAAAAFTIARAALELRNGPSLLAVVLVVLSPPVLESWVFGLAYAIEPLATMFVASAFLAVVARRDLFCLVLLFVALLTKENTVWATVAAAITIMLRPRPDEPLRSRAFAAATMFLPVVMWLGFRFTFFDGIGSTYATQGYVPIANFLKLTFYKLTHLDALFVSPAFFINWSWALIDRLLIYALLCLWVLRILPETMDRLRNALHEKSWPTVDATFLVALWAAIAFAFYFALPVQQERYATSIVVFAWPALVAEIVRRRKASLWLVLAACCVVLLTRSVQYSVEGMAKAQTRLRALRPIDAALRQVPMTTRQVYVLAADGLQAPAANPEYVRLVLGMDAKMIILADAVWRCSELKESVAFDHNTVDGVVIMNITLPACAKFVFSGRFDNNVLADDNRHLFRNEIINYELPEAYRISPTTRWELAFYLGRKMTVHVRPNGPARFIIQRGGAGGIAWFDTP